MISKTRTLVILLLFAVTWYVLQITSEVAPVEIKKTLSRFPPSLGSYHLTKSFQSSSEVLELLGVDDYIQYNYVDKHNERINLYAGYYKAVGVSGSYHSPKNCIPGGGWGIDSVRQVVLDSGIEGKKQAKVSEMIIRNGDELQVVLYWYQNRGRIISSEYLEKIYLVVDAIFMGRRDGTFVRIISYIKDGDIEKTRARVKNFAEIVMTQLEEHLPGAEL